jgi:ABC-type polysaccharide/polyol phosphate transport system ATPase subunit
VSAIHLDGVGKKYIQQVDRSLLVKRLVGLQGRQRHEMWALRDISFDIEAGSTVGVIGRNGSGKTTLLRLLSGVSAPTTGRLRIEGRIAPLIGVGVGFNSELSGRENVFVNGQLLGMSEAEVHRKFDDIVSFAEMEAFVDTPVKYYSSGMFLRLGFSVAIHNEPDVLVVDEVLAVGDGAFQLKCFERMREMQQRGTTVVIVTHNLQALHQMAPRAILLSHGQMVFDGAAETALGEYQKLMQVEDAEFVARSTAEAIDPTEHRMVGGATVEVELLDDDGRASHHFASGAEVTVRVTAHFTTPVSRPGLGLMVALPGQGAVFTAHSPPGAYTGRVGPDQPLIAEIRLRNRLLTRNYSVSAMVVDGTGHGVLGASLPVPFYVTSPYRMTGIVDLEPEFTLNGEQIPLPRVHRLSDEGNSAGTPKT